MRVIEVPQSPGLWTCPLLPNTPQYVVDFITDHLAFYGQIAGEPSLPVAWYPNQSGLLSVARNTNGDLETSRYTGRIMGIRWDGARFVLFGEGLESFLQSNANIGGHWNDFDTSTPGPPGQTTLFRYQGQLAGFLLALKNRSGTGAPYFPEGWTLGGLEPGSQQGGMPIKTIDVEWYPGLGEREFIDWAFSQFVDDPTQPVPEWRVTPDGRIDFGFPEFLYRNNEVIISPTPAAAFDSERRGVAGVLASSLDLSQTGMTGIAYGPGEGALIEVAFRGTVGGNVHSFSGRTSHKLRPSTGAMWPQILSDDPGITDDPAEIIELAQRAAYRAQEIRQPVTVTSGDPDAPDYITAGDAVLFIDQPEWAQDPGNPVVFAGEILYPRSLNVHQATYQFGDQWEIVFHDTVGGSAPLPISEFVDYPQPSTVLTLGIGRGHASLVTLVGPDRLINRPDQPWPEGQEPPGYPEGTLPPYIPPVTVLPITPGIPEGTGPNNPPEGTRPLPPREGDF